jgi:hypothetical protein
MTDDWPTPDPNEYHWAKPVPALVRPHPTPTCQNCKHWMAPCDYLDIPGTGNAGFGKCEFLSSSGRWVWNGDCDVASAYEAEFYCKGVFSCNQHQPRD